MLQRRLDYESKSVFIIDFGSRNIGRTDVELARHVLVMLKYRGKEPQRPLKTPGSTLLLFSKTL